MGLGLVATGDSHPRAGGEIGGDQAPLQHLGGLAFVGIEQRVGEGHTHPFGHRFDPSDLIGVEAAVLLSPPQGQGAHQPISRPQRRAQDQGQTVVGHCGGQGRDLVGAAGPGEANHLRAPGPGHPCLQARTLERHAYPLRVGKQDLIARGPDRSCCHRDQEPAVVDYVHSRPVAEVGEDRLGEGDHQLVQLEGCGQSIPRPGEQFTLVLLHHLRRDVREEVDRPHHLARVVLDRARADPRPAGLSRVPVAVTHHLFRYRLAAEDLAPGQSLGVEQVPGGVDQVETGQKGTGGSGEHLLSGVEPQQGGRPVVGVDDPATLVLDGDRFGSVHEEDIQYVAALVQG